MHENQPFVTLLLTILAGFAAGRLLQRSLSEVPGRPTFYRA